MYTISLIPMLIIPCRCVCVCVVCGVCVWMPICCLAFSLGAWAQYLDLPYT